MAIGTSMPAITSGISNVIYGSSSSGIAINSGNQNVLIGSNNGSKLTSGSDNVFLGTGVGHNAIASSQNVGIGTSCLAAITTGSSSDGNIAIGYSSLGNLVSGTRNICIGYNTGTNYNTSESSNILINNAGLITETNTIRIGTAGSSQGQQNKAYLAGVTGVTVSASSPMGVDTNGQLSDLGFGTATNVLTSNGAGVSPSWQAALGFSPVNFSARLTGNISNVTGDGTDYAILYDNVEYNVGGGAYNGATGEYTFPQLGKYLITVTNFIFGGGVADTVFLGSLVVNGSTTFRLMDANPGTLGLIANGEFMQSASFLYEVAGIRSMAVHVNVIGGTKNVGVAGGTQSCIFSIFRVA